MRTTAAASVLGLLALVGTAHGQVRAWANPVNGNWSVAANWMPMDVPNTLGESALLGLSGAYAVTLDTPVLTTIASLGLVAGPRLDIAPFTELVIGGGGPGAVSNDGLIRLNPSASAFNAVLTFGASGSIGGSGTLQLIGGFDDAQLNAPAGVVITNEASHTIEGAGQINAEMVNDGVLRAENLGFGNALEINGFITNNSGMVASANAELQIRATEIDQTGGGTLDAGAGTLVFFQNTDSVIRSGVIESTDGGTIVRRPGTTTFEDVELLSDLSIDPSGTVRVTGSGLTNEGTIFVNDTTSAFNSAVVFVDSGELRGSGTLFLGGGGDDAQLNTEPGAVIQHAGPHTIAGTGQLNAALVNDGTVRAEAASFGNALTLRGEDKANRSRFLSSTGATLEIGPITIDQNGGGVIDAADGSVVFLSGNNSAIVRGVIRASAGGTVRRQAGTTVLDGVTLEDLFIIDPTGTVRVTASGLTNNGRIDINPTSSAFNGILIADGPAALDGTGTIVLGGGGDDASIDSEAGASFTQGAGHTIEGGGRITAALVNNGLVRAAVTPFANTLELVGEDKVNNSVMGASQGATLLIGGIDLTQNAGAALRSNDGLIVFANATDSAVSGGSIDGSARRDAGRTTLDGVTLTGTIDIQPTGTIAVGPNGLLNNGMLIVNNTNSAFNGIVSFPGDATLGGFGTTLLGGGSDDSQIRAEPGATGTIGPGQVIAGEGQLAGSLVVEGAISIGLSSGSAGELFLAPLEPGDGLTLTSTSSVDVDLISPANHDQFARNNSGYAVNLGGTLNAFVNPAYSPRLGDEFDIVELGGPVTGAFGTFNIAGVPAGYAFVEVVRANEYVLRVINSTCAADLAEPYGSLTFADISSFLAAFNAGEPPADLAAPFGQYTFADIASFLGSFAAGCP